MPSRSFFEVPDQIANKLVISQYHPDGVSDIDRLVARGIAPLLDVDSLSRLIGVGNNIIYSVSNNQRAHYRHFYIRKKSGGMRLISSPRTYLKVVQWWLLDNILKSQPLDDCVTAFHRGASPLANAQRHVGSSHILCMDLKDFFPSIGIDRVLKYWIGLGYNEQVALQLAKISTLDGVLPQGAPTSPALSNLIASDLDKKLRSISQPLGYSYTRYADDLTFSSQHAIPFEFSEQISDIVASSGFLVNGKKTRFIGRGAAMEVTGYIINSHPQLSRKWRKMARAAFHNAKVDPGGHVDKLNFLRGLFGAVSSFTDEGSALRAEGIRAIEAVKASKQRTVVK